MAHLPPPGWVGSWSDLEAFVIRLYPVPAALADAAVYPYQIAILQGGHGGSLSPTGVVDVGGLAAQDAVRATYAALTSRLNRIGADRTSVTFRLLPMIEQAEPDGTPAGHPWPDPTVRLDFTVTRQSAPRQLERSPWQGVRLEDAIMVPDEPDEDELDEDEEDEPEEEEEEDEPEEDSGDAEEGGNEHDLRNVDLFGHGGIPPAAPTPSLVRQSTPKSPSNPPAPPRRHHMDDNRITLTPAKLDRLLRRAALHAVQMQQAPAPTVPPDAGSRLIDHLIQVDAASRDREGERLAVLTGTIENLTAQLTSSASAAVELERARSEQLRALMEEKIRLIQQANAEKEAALVAAMKREAELAQEQNAELREQLAEIGSESAETINRLAADLAAARARETELATEKAVAGASAGGDNTDAIIAAVAPEVLKRIMDRVMPGTPATAPVAPAPVPAAAPSRLPAARPPEVRLPPRVHVADHAPAMQPPMGPPAPPTPPAPPAADGFETGIKAAAEGLNQIAQLPSPLRKVLLKQVRKHLDPTSDLGDVINDLTEAVLEQE